MFQTRKETSDRIRNEFIDEMADRIAFIKDRADDRIGAIWALKIIAETIKKLDDRDRLEGFLPLEVRPPLMLSCDEAALALHALREYKGRKGCEVSGNTIALMERLDCYFE